MIDLKNRIIAIRAAIGPIEGGVDLHNKLTAARAALLDSLSIIAAGGAGELTPARVALLDNLDVAISSRAAPGDEMTLTVAELLVVQALVLSDATPFPGGSIDAAISSRAATGEAVDALSAITYTRQAGVRQVAPTTIDLDQVAASYDLYTATDQDVIVESLVIRMSGGAIAGAVTSISIQTDDATPIVFIDDAVTGLVANLTNEAQLYWTGAALLDAGTGAKIQLTINGGATGVARVCDVVVTCRAVVAGGYLA